MVPQHARPSQQLIESTGVNPADGIIDVDRGASTLVDALLDTGHTDITVLDISAEGLHTAQRRLGQRSETVSWLVADLLDGHPIAPGIPGTTEPSCTSSPPTPTASTT